MADTKQESFLDMRSVRLMAFLVTCIVFVSTGKTDDLKTIVWTQYFHSVFSEMNTQTFENVSVWTEPKKPKLFSCAVIQISENTFRKAKWKAF